MLVNSEVIAEHAEESAFLWTMRHQAVGAPQDALKDLAALDDRNDAHLAGLRIAGERPGGSRAKQISSIWAPAKCSPSACWRLSIQIVAA